MNIKKGFTLVELVVAIAILGVITLMAIPTVNTVQKNNRKSKYLAYEKSLKAASKSYTDAYDEDLFGATNSGCATITYSDLKEKDLATDIQLKGTSCNNNNTFVYVIKSKNGNYKYFSNIECSEGNSIVYSNHEIARDKCQIEDGKGPKINILATPEKNTYYIGDKPKIKLIITDNGIGLRENQKLTYEWYKNGTKIPNTKKTIEFKNKNYQGRAVKIISIPSDFENNIDEPTNLTIKVTGKVYDVNLNYTTSPEKNTSEPIQKTLHYFVGALYIKYKVNGAKMINPHNQNYKISNDYVAKGTNIKVHKVKYKGKINLWNYNNKGLVNLKKDFHHMDAKKEWKKGSNIYDQDKNPPYEMNAFGVSENALKKQDVVIEVEANWQKDKFTLTYNDNGGSGCSNKGVTREYDTKWNSNCKPVRSGYLFGGWNVNSSIIQSADLSERKATSNITATATWVHKTLTINYNANGSHIYNPTNKRCGNKDDNYHDSFYDPFYDFHYDKGDCARVYDPYLSVYNDAYYAKYGTYGYSGNNSFSRYKVSNSDSSISYDDESRYGRDYGMTHGIPNKNYGKVSITITGDQKVNILNISNKGDGIPLVKDHYHLEKGKEWNTKPNGGGVSIDQSKSLGIEDFGLTPGTMKDNETITIYANWKIDEYTLTYDNRGGTGCTTPIKRKYGESWGTLCTPTKGGEYFRGWNTRPMHVYSGAKATRDVTATASWSIYSGVNGIAVQCSRDNVFGWVTQNGTSYGPCDGLFVYGTTLAPAGHWRVTVSDFAVTFNGTNTVQTAKGHTYCFYVYSYDWSKYLTQGCQHVDPGYKSNVTLYW